ncbi:transglutaminase-like domain-containing protein [Cnuibacter physcomitrellae]|uniref:transglutaminase-like domain-containing protein n=1 Tax=Cnuibacter physcomitrellae TaxID=1619308 RepID=UPI002175EFDD|nr:transglutaminase-like domain-containing protein [Cnuibacter physcomitrellae]MCS5498748.1 transglutaminase-like domain-containing protein [Cnuibacter physcomitrellae]
MSALRPGGTRAPRGTSAASPARSAWTPSAARSPGPPLRSSATRSGGPSMPDRSSPSTRRRALLALVAVGLVVIGAAAWWPVYASPWFLICAGGALIAGVALAGAGAVARWRPHVVLLAVAGAWLLLGVPLAVPSQALWGVLPTPQGLVDLITTSATGWRALLTIDPPVGDFQALLVPLFVLVLAASASTVSLALRSARPALSLLPPVVVLLAGLAFGDGDPLAPLALGGAFALLALLALALLGSASISRTLVAGLLVLVTVAAGVGAGALVVGGSRAAVRDAVPQPFDPRRLDSPLSGFRADIVGPEADAVRLDVPSSLAGRLVSIARMDSYDGVVYRVGDSTEASSLFSRVPQSIGPALPGESEYSLTVEAAGGVWLPLPGAPSSIEFDAGAGSGTESTSPSGAAGVDPQDDLFYSRPLETAAVSTGLVAGTSYRVRSTLIDEIAEPADLVPGAAVAPSPTAPPEVAAWAADHADADAAPAERLASLVDALRQGYVSHGQQGEPFSRSGHGADRIAELLTDTPMLGDDEQYAVAGALLAQQVGFPARVALGYRVPSNQDGVGPIAVTGRDTVAWVEVLDAERGWVAIDVTPLERPVPDDVDEQQSTTVQPPRVLPPRSSDENIPPDTTTTQPTDRDEPQRDPFAELLRAVAIWTGLGTAVLAVLLSPFLAVIAAKVVRRSRRRRRGDPRDRAAQAWSEIRDAGVDARLLPRRTSTAPASTRAETASALDSPAARDIAVLVDRAQFAPTVPLQADLDRIWAQTDEERTRIMRTGGRWSRLRATISLRSLRTYHGKGGRRTSE